MGKDAATLEAMIHDNLSGMATIANYSRQESEAERVEQAGSRFRTSTHQRQLVSSAYVPAIKAAVAPGFIATLIYGVRLVSQGKISAGGYNVLGYSSLRLYAALGRLGIGIEQYQRTKISLGRIEAFLETQPAIIGGERALDPSAMAGDIRFDDVTFGYQPDRPVLRGIQLHFPAGATTGIVGATGAGKTTLLKLLLCFYDADVGSIRIDGEDIREFRLEDLRRTMAMVPQQIFLFGGTIRENIAYGHPDATMRDLVRAAQITEAHEFIEALPDGYDTIIGEGGVKLSGGQQQRIGIARAVLADRPIFLFDEATSAIDFETEAAIQRSLRDVTEGRTTVIIAHRLSTIRNADIIYVMDNGTVVESGKHDELIQSGGLYANMWRVQTGEVLPSVRLLNGSGRLCSPARKPDRCIMRMIGHDEQPAYYGPYPIQ